MGEIFKINLKQAEEVHIKDTAEGNILLSPIIGGDFSGMAEGTVEPFGILITDAVEPYHHNQSVSVVLTDKDGGHIFFSMESRLDWNEEIENRIVNDGIGLDEYLEKGEAYATGIGKILTDSDRYRHLERKILPCRFEMDTWDVFTIVVSDPI